MSNGTSVATKPDVFADIAELCASHDEEQGAQWRDHLPLTMWACMTVRHVGNFAEEWFDPAMPNDNARRVVCRDRLVNLAATAVAGAEAIACHRASEAEPEGSVKPPTRADTIRRVRQRLPDVRLRSKHGDILLHICDLSAQAGHLGDVSSLGIAFAERQWRAEQALIGLAATAVKIIQQFDNGDVAV